MTNESNEPQATIDALGLSVESVFVPWSQSRKFKKGAKLLDRSLNWRVTVKRHGDDILSCDYSAGIGHVPSYKYYGMADLGKAVEFELEHGREAKSGKPIMSDATDVLASLVIDSGAIDSADFEEWANDLGYDTDSRKAEAIYRACLEIGLKLRVELGDDGLQRLREAFQDY